MPAPIAVHVVVSIAPCAFGAASAKTTARTAANEIGPARLPHAIVSIATSTMPATTAATSAGAACAVATTSAVEAQPRTPPATERGATTRALPTTWGRLAQIAPVLASRAALDG